jgi:hypothetical protein
LEIEHRVRNVALAEKCLLWLQLDDGSAKAGVCKEASGIERIAVVARQNVTSLLADSLTGRYMFRKVTPTKTSLLGIAFRVCDAWVRSRKPGDSLEPGG